MGNNWIRDTALNEPSPWPFMKANREKVDLVSSVTSIKPTKINRQKRVLAPETNRDLMQQYDICLVGKTVPRE